MTIHTFIFFDLETTGLIQGKIMPRITEIALVAVTRESMCKSNGNSLPRILHKLVLPVNPQKVIPPRVEYLTKLFNEDMLLLKPFECKIYELIIHFLQRLTPPICFVAHNGDRFDYPIFLWELECINKIFDSKILCIDTWKMFQDFFRKQQTTIVQYSNPIEDLLNDEYNESLSAVLDVVMKDVEVKAVQDVATTSSMQTLPYVDRHTKISGNNESNTSKRHNDIDDQSLNSKQKAYEKTPENQIIKLENVSAERPWKRNNPRRRLNFSYERPVSLKLAAIYEYMFGSNFTHEHSAEADCLAMIRCVSQITDFFLEWSENHAFPLIYCKKT